MTFPERLATALDEAGITPETGSFARETDCEGARFHSPNPLVIREVCLAPDNEGVSALLCGTCADNLAVLQSLLLRHDGDVEWPVRREFGNLVRALALRGWEDYKMRLNG